MNARGLIFLIPFFQIPLPGPYTYMHSLQGFGLAHSHFSYTGSANETG